MNDLERRMDNVDLNRGRGAPVGEYNRKQTATRTRPLPFTVYRQDRHIKPRSRLHRPTWV
jgi:hypothetical protein